MTQPNNSQRLWMYEQMLTSRYMEESIERIYMEGKTPVFNMAKGPIPGEMHLSNGQEPCAVGVCAHLEAGDIVTATHRPHHIAVAKGVDLNEMMAEIFGKATGLSGGRGGHMHLFDGRVNFSCSGIIAEGMGPAVGAALSRQMQGKPGVAVSFIGEGAANQGAFHETLNLAALWKLPVVFVIEDNAWGISVAKASATCIKQHHVRAAAYGMPGVFVENNDPDGVFCACRWRPDPHRDRDLPPGRPLHGRRRNLPPRGREGRPDEKGPDSRLPPAPDRRRRDERGTGPRHRSPRPWPHR